MRTAAGIADREQNQLAAPVHKAIEGIDERSAEFLQRSISLTEDTFLNMLDYAEQLVRATEPQELAQVQTDFVNRQSQKVADQARQLGQAMMQHASKLPNGLGVRRSLGFPALAFPAPITWSGDPLAWELYSKIAERAQRRFEAMAMPSDALAHHSLLAVSFSV
jgi:hypothetical protein